MAVRPHTQPFLASATMLSVERQKVITMARIADVLPLLLLNPRYLEGGPSAAACLRARARDKGFSFSIYLSVCLSIYLCVSSIYVHTHWCIYRRRRRSGKRKRRRSVRYCVRLEWAVCVLGFGRDNGVLREGALNTTFNPHFPLPFVCMCICARAKEYYYMYVYVYEYIRSVRVYDMHIYTGRERTYVICI